MLTLVDVGRVGLLPDLFALLLVTIDGRRGLLVARGRRGLLGRSGGCRREQKKRKRVFKSAHHPNTYPHRLQHQKRRERELTLGGGGLASGGLRLLLRDCSSHC